MKDLPLLSPWIVIFVVSVMSFLVIPPLIYHSILQEVYKKIEPHIFRFEKTFNIKRKKRTRKGNPSRNCQIVSQHFLLILCDIMFIHTGKWIILFTIASTSFIVQCCCKMNLTTLTLTFSQKEVWFGRFNVIRYVSRQWHRRWNIKRICPFTASFPAVYLT